MDSALSVGSEASSLLSAYTSMWDQLLLPAIFFVAMLLGFVLTVRPREKAVEIDHRAR